MKILIDGNIPGGTEVFSRYGAVQAYSGRTLGGDLIKNTDALIVRSTLKVNEQLLSGSFVKFVGTATIGTDHIDQAFLGRNNITFAHAPGCNAPSVGQYWAAALLNLQQKYQLVPKKLTLGIIGYGNTGKQVEKKALALGMRVLKNDPPLQDADKHRDDLVPVSGIQKEADIISFHVPLTKSGPHPTLEMVNTSFLQTFSKPLIFFNCSRGGVISKSAVMQARQQNLITSLVLDVFPDEPVIDPELVSICDIATPHIAGYSQQGKYNGTLAVLKAFCTCFKLDLPESFNAPVPKEGFINYRPMSDDDFILHCVHRSYPIMQDDANLRKSLKSKDPGSAFDALRKNYAPRHEFPLYTVTDIPADKDDLRNRLGKLGFNV